MQTLRLANLGVRFLLELASLGAFGYWGWTLRGTPALRVAAAIGVPLGVAAVWGVFVSPRAPLSTGIAGQASLGLTVFLGAAWALHARGHERLAFWGAAVACVSAVLHLVLARGDDGAAG